jgi:hypothetical protein
VNVCATTPAVRIGSARPKRPVSSIANTSAVSGARIVPARIAAVEIPFRVE